MNTVREALDQYIAVRRALGSKFRDYAPALRTFVESLEREKAEYITIDLAVRWATTSKQVQKTTWARRLCMVRGFAAWLSAVDARTQVPPTRLLGGSRGRTKPHIYSDQEVNDLMGAACQLRSRGGLRALTYTTLIGLLWATGLRPGEALALNANDVDLQTGILAVNDSKFGKSRFVPVEDSTRTALAAYAAKSNQLCALRRSNAFLISEDGTRLEACAVRRTFAKMSRKTGLRLPARTTKHSGHGPRLQDFRHTFTTLKLLEWYRSGIDVQRELPKLATYLGHVDLIFTYWYIEGVPELLKLASQYKQPGGTV